MALKYDVSSLCTLVESRPCLWDKRNSNYKNKILRDRAWEEIFKFLDDEFETRTAEEKKQTGDKIMTKWTNVRDAFIRSLKTKSGQAAKKNYIYHEHLLFLLAAHEPSETQSSSLAVDDEESDQPSQLNESIIAEEQDLPSKGHSRKRPYKCVKEISFLEKEIIDELKNIKEEETKCSFFSSFEEYVADMTESEKLELHMNIIKSISEIKSRRSQPLYFIE